MHFPKISQKYLLVQILMLEKEKSYFAVQFVYTEIRDLCIIFAEQKKATKFTPT